MAIGKENQFKAIRLNICKITEPVNNFQNHRVTLFVRFLSAKMTKTNS